jgi:hypothetical protein
VGAKRTTPCNKRVPPSQPNGCSGETGASGGRGKDAAWVISKKLNLDACGAPVRDSGTLTERCLRIQE